MHPTYLTIIFHFALKEIRASIKRIIDLYSIKTCDTVLEPKYTSSNIYGDISIKNLSYSYNKKDKILKNIQESIEKYNDLRYNLFGFLLNKVYEERKFLLEWKRKAKLKIF